MQEIKQFKWAKSYATLQEQRVFLKLHIHRRFSVDMRYLFSVQCCAVSTNLKMTCPDQHKFISKQASECFHCVTCI
jgi:hypothetical protein